MEEERVLLVEDPGLVKPNVVSVSDLSNHAGAFRFFSF